MKEKCGGCGNFDGTRCLKGDSGEMYCLGGSYELFTPRAAGAPKVTAPMDEVAPPVDSFEDYESQQPAEEQPDDEFEEREAEDREDAANASVERADLGYELNSPEAMELLKRLERGEEISDAEMAKTLSPEQMDAFKHMISQMADVAKRPKSLDEGFNGVKKTDAPQGVTSCQGCRNHSMIGCFLGKYYECVDNGYFLYAGVPLESAEYKKGAEESIEEKEDIDIIEGLLNQGEKNIVDDILGDEGGQA